MLSQSIRLSFVLFGVPCSAFTFAQTTSPFPPPDQDLGKYVVNSGSGLDTGCTYRSGGPLIIKLEVPATMNKKALNADGTLQDPAKLIADKVIGSTAKISLPAYDIDDKAVTNGYAPEVDRMYFNGEFIKTLSGFNNTWVNDSFSVDIGKVRFKSESTPSAVNEIRIDIDTANSYEYWCMAVDWVGIEFDAAAPYVLAHGIAADAGTWEAAAAPGVLKAMDDSNVLYTRFSTANANGSVAANAMDLKSKVQGFVDTVKSKKVNVIAHSKGGLDSQALALLAPPDFEMLSLSTLSTPH
jgi:triacylglycerol lipase